MKNIYNFGFIETDDDIDLMGLIILINRARHQAISYRRIIKTAARRGWIALMIDSAEPDHYLLRNLSARLKTQAFAFGLNDYGLYYRLFDNGQSLSAYESNIEAWIENQLRTLTNTGDVLAVDLAEPGGRLVLKHFHEHQRSRSWTQPVTIAHIPDAVRAFYAGHLEEIAHLFTADTAVSYMQGITAPDFDPDDGLNRLANGLNLPYTVGDIVEAPGLANDAEPRIVKGYEILRPSTWPEGSNLPDGWHVVPAENWESEHS